MEHALVCMARGSGMDRPPCGVVVIGKEPPPDADREAVDASHAADAQTIRNLFYDCLPTGTCKALRTLMNGDKL